MATVDTTNDKTKNKLFSNRKKGKNIVTLTFAWSAEHIPLSHSNDVENYHRTSKHWANKRRKKKKQHFRFAFNRIHDQRVIDERQRRPRIDKALTKRARYSYNNERNHAHTHEKCRAANKYISHRRNACRNHTNSDIERTVDAPVTNELAQRKDVFLLSFICVTNFVFDSKKS